MYQKMKTKYSTNNFQTFNQEFAFCKTTRIYSIRKKYVFFIIDPHHPLTSCLFALSSHGEIRSPDHNVPTLFMSQINEFGFNELNR
jgi:hypothetical protein